MIAMTTSSSIKVNAFFWRMDVIDARVDDSKAAQIAASITSCDGSVSSGERSRLDRIRRRLADGIFL
jgi:hypothetical protein